MIRILPLLLVLLTAACTSGRGGLAPDPDARFRERVVDSEDGQWRLHIRHLALDRPAIPGAPARLSMQATLDLKGEDSLLADRDPLVGLQREAGVDHPVTPHVFQVDSVGGGIRLRNLDVGAPADRLARLDLVCTVLDVQTFKPRVFPDLGPVRRGGLEADPFVLTVTGERHNVWVAASRLDPPPGTVKDTDLSVLLGHRWAAENATIHDAAGRLLHAWGGSGTEGGTVIGYGAPISETPFPIAYPVTLELMVPERYSVHTVRFRIEDLQLPPREG